MAVSGRGPGIEKMSAREDGVEPGEIVACSKRDLPQVVLDYLRDSMSRQGRRFIVRGGGRQASRDNARRRLQSRHGIACQPPNTGSALRKLTLA